MCVVGLEAEDQVLPLGIVADEAAETRNIGPGVAKDLESGGHVLRLQHEITQAEAHEWFGGFGKIGPGAAVADLPAEIKAGPAREGRRSDGHRAHRDVWVIIGRERARRERKEGPAAQRSQRISRAPSCSIWLPQKPEWECWHWPLLSTFVPARSWVTRVGSQVKVSHQCLSSS